MRNIHWVFLSSLFLPACNGGGNSSDKSVPIPDTGQETGTETGTETGEEPLACADELVEALPWFEEAQTGALAGSAEFGQTHVVRAQEDRYAPPVIAERETLLLFTPEAVLDDTTDLRVGAFDGETLLGVLALAPPSASPDLQEQGLTAVALDPYSTEAWSANLPWTWVKEGVALRVGHVKSGGLVVLEQVLEELGAPHKFTHTRGKMVLFGDGTEDTFTLAGTRLARDHFASLPAAELRLVDATPWRLDELVVTASDGPVLVDNEADRVTASGSDRWSIIKHQFALRHSLANTGRGLAMTTASEGDNSPYSYGTSFVMGWVADADGNTSDLNNAPWAAGWTGWTALWLGECGNTLAHELGHSFTLLHFDGGTADSWGIDAEYLEDGTSLEGHPWGYDTTRRQIRTWYRVDSSGPVMNGTELQGKRDPMNGGESSNDLTCFPQYTGYHAQKTQNWAQSSPTLRNEGGVPGLYAWDSATHAYAPAAVSEGYGTPLAVDVPVVTLVGTLGNTDAACQTYPPMFASEGNVFALPAPDDVGLDATYDGATWFLSITYADGTVERALIAKGHIEDTALSLYSLNLKWNRTPTQVDLYVSDTEYPSIDVSGATLMHSRAISAPVDAIAEPVVVGHGHLANGALELEKMCTPDVDCGHRTESSTWRGAGVRVFQDTAGQSDAPESCLEQDGFTSLSVPVVTSDGTTATLTLHAQRVLSTGSETVAVPMNDDTPWLQAPDLEQSLQVWLPWEENQGLAAGTYVNDGEFGIESWVGGVLEGVTPIQVDVQVREILSADLASQYWTDPAVMDATSSVFFLVEDGTMGPTDRAWWDGSADPVQLTPPVVDQTTGTLTTLLLDAYKVACSDWWDFNTGQSATLNCENFAVLSVAASGNEHLVSGHTYVSPGSSPLVLEARRWHAPDAWAILDTFALQVEYTAP